MQKKILFYISFALVGNFSTNAFASQANNDKGTIYWQTYHRPPGIIKEGTEQGSGFVEKALKLIIKEMPEYKHEFPIASLTRALTNIKLHKNVCHPALYKTKERQEYVAYSEATIINPGNRVIARKGTLDEIAEGNYIDLKKLLSSQKYAFSLIKKRSYGQVVDDKISKHLTDSKSQLLASTELGTLFHMVERRRVDFTIAFPFELNYFIEKNKIKDDVFVSYYIKDIPKFTLGYVACPKNAWGKEVINKVNRVLKNVKRKQSYKEAVTSWWGHEQFTEEFIHFYNNRFLNH